MTFSAGQFVDVAGCITTQRVALLDILNLSTRSDTDQLIDNSVGCCWTTEARRFCRQEESILDALFKNNQLKCYYHLWLMIMHLWRPVTCRQSTNMPLLKKPWLKPTELKNYRPVCLLTFVGWLSSIPPLKVGKIDLIQEEHVSTHVRPSVSRSESGSLTDLTRIEPVVV